MSNLKTLIVGSTLALAAIGAYAQAVATPAMPRADQRAAKQQARIGQGVASGQLNARETNRLDKQQARVATAETKAKSDGVVTGTERRQLRRMQDRSSKNIHHQKNDAQAAVKP